MPFNAFLYTDRGASGLIPDTNRFLLWSVPTQRS